ncbi:MAG: hypothetical protein ACYTXI_41355 [Nostoc sp.]
MQQRLICQEISGHRNFEQLQRYLEVTDNQVLGAAASLAMLSPVVSNGVELQIDMGLKGPTVEHSISD